MMQMGRIFSGMGMFSGWIWVLILPVAIFLGIIFFRWLTGRSYRGLNLDRLRKPKTRDQPIQYQIMRLAFENGGLLTVTDVVLETELPIKQAEETLNSMVDSYRVKMEVEDSGIVVYEFVELINGKEGSRGS